MRNGPGTPPRGGWRQSRWLRWAVATASSGLLIAAITSFVTAGTATAGQSPGQGNSYAQSLQVTPHEGSLAVGAVFGEALAGHTNTFARAQSQGLDLGAVGVSMSTDNCGQPPQAAQFVPQPLQTETGSQGASQGQTQTPSKSNYFSNEYVLANDTPYGEADTNYAGPLADPTGAFTVSGMKSKSWSGLVNGTNEAAATSDIKSLSLGAGAVVLNGLHWEVMDPTGGTPTGSFSIGQAIISGNAVPNPGDLSAVQSAINKVLGTLGLQVQLPQTSLTQGLEAVSPLEIEVVPNATRDSLVDPAVVAAQPPYYQATNGLENGFGSDNPPLNSLGQTETGPNGQQLATALCQSDTPITVLDITIASFDGGGFFNAALGGVNAGSSLLPSNSYNLAALGFGTLNVAGTSQLTPGSAGSLGTTGSFGPGANGTGGAGGGGGGLNGASPAGASRGAGGLGAAGGPLLAAGLAGLGLLGLLLAADGRKMRIAHRTLPFAE